MVPADEENLHEWSQIVLVVHNPGSDLLAAGAAVLLLVGAGTWTGGRFCRSTQPRTVPRWRNCFFGNGGTAHRSLSKQLRAGIND